MFTGLIEMTGSVVAADRRAGHLQLAIRSGFSGLVLGESIAVDGCCLTVTGTEGEQFFADVAEESLRRTTLGALRVGDKVHLERAMQLGDRLGGHIVQGHVDGVATLTETRADGDALWLTFRAPATLSRYMVEKGSVTLSGVSLTLTAVGEGTFSVMIIPHTQTLTTLGTLAVAQQVNLEVDVLAKHLERLALPYLEQVRS
jgi:riboflavin synthase